MTAFMNFDEANGWYPLAQQFLSLFGLVLLALVIVLVSVGLVFEFLNARHPERKIQKGRTNKRKWKELYRAPGSLVIIAFCFSGGLFAQMKGWTITPYALNWWTGPLLLAASVLLYDTWFYWIHRLLHCKPFYRFHALHHKSLAPTVWSNHNESLPEAFFNQAYYLIIPFFLPIPWQMLVLQKLYDQISGMLGHAGFEHFASPAGRTPFPLASTVFHDQHHSHFAYNYGHTFSIWDRMLGTLYPKYDETLESFEHTKPAKTQ